MRLPPRSAQEQIQLVRGRLGKSEGEALIFGIDLLDDLLRGFLPSELILLYGSSSYALSDLLIVRALMHDKTAKRNVVYIDGGNCFNLYRISAFVRQLGLNVEDSLRRIHISRAFTSHQLATLVARELSHELDRHPARLAIVSDLLSISRDEEIEAKETRDMMSIAMRNLRDLTTARQVITVLPNPALTTERERQDLETFLWAKSDAIFRLRESKNRTRIFREKHPMGEGRVDFDLTRLRDIGPTGW